MIRSRGKTIFNHLSEKENRHFPARERCSMISVHQRDAHTRKINMKRLGTVVLALGMTFAMATGSWAQVGRDSAQGGTGMSQKGGSMGQKGSGMQNGNMQKGSSGTMSK
jgi:hypothetical protein